MAASEGETLLSREREREREEDLDARSHSRKEAPRRRGDFFVTAAVPFLTYESSRGLAGGHVPSLIVFGGGAALFHLDICVCTLSKLIS